MSVEIAEKKISPNDIDEFFKEYGWEFECDREQLIWQTGFAGKTRNFDILINLTDDWLYFIVPQFVNAPSDPSCISGLYRHLLRLNHYINMAKFSVDSDGDIILSVELPSESLDFSEFVDGLEALSVYADRYYLELLNASQDPSYQPKDPALEEAFQLQQNDAGEKTLN